MPVIHEADAKRFELHGAEFLGFASPSRGANENSVWRVRVPGGSAGVTHQVTREEVLVVLSGSAQAALGGETFEIVAGSTLVVPRDTDFTLSVPGTESFEAIAILPVGGRARIDGQEPFVPPWAA